ncbi:aldehyde dehydrogenase family protein [Aspergillus nomiae NRRL 13137]|uniref:Aldehyde dehydrogenase family protein n=1 Tax=Aspergillus nomiae NRRL (strain ATCC 15546 / NRRL 13137 / CBS 260.88 / M93) TaxID=1509407 RepID=A0A0L1INK8_ASPN3|nr:aldehyde dehydrogenase family protein [Aspergillus nomiae NRRL 13137]KNG81082.1 aldehyde dehydrogenase family protein [Aspergillus nomiae NRRL 13137]
MSANGTNSKGVIPLIINNNSVVTETIFDVHNPATGEVIDRCASASVDDVNRISSRRRQTLCFPEEELIKYQMEETGAGRMFVEKTFEMGAAFIKDFAARIPSIEGSVPSVSEQGECAMVFKEPYGVVLGIAPWNAPYILGTRAIALPLAAGNTAVLKGSELSPKCFWSIGDIFREAGLPAGCLNVVYHRPADAAPVTTALIAHPAVRKISFTGSTQVGSIIASTAGKYVKPVVLELGGKASAIVLDDANLERAAMSCSLGAFMHSGQICMSTERIVVQRSIADRFRTLLADASETVFGKHTPAPVLVASAAGADLVYGERNPSEESGNSLRPVIVGNVTKDMDLYSAESFGPTVSLMVVDTEEEAVALANDTEYGLTSAVFTDNLFRGLRVAKQIESGAVHINSLTVHDEPVLPHGGWKSSGYGRFGGPAAYDEWLQTKTVTWVQ